MERVVAELAELQDPFLYWGFFDGRAPVQTRGKWADSSYKLCDRSVLNCSFYNTIKELLTNCRQSFHNHGKGPY